VKSFRSPGHPTIPKQQSLNHCFPEYKVTGDKTKVLIRAPNWVGDVVMAIPALREFRRMFADAEITLLARSWVSGLLDYEELADRIIQTEEFDLRSPIKFIKLVRRLRRDRYEFAVLLQNAFSAAVVAKAAGARHIAGYPADGRRRLLDLVVPFAPDSKTSHQVFYYLRIAARVEEELTGKTHVDLTNPSPILRVTRDAKENARRMILDAAGRRGPAKAESIDLSREKILILNPGATNSRAKQWLPERFAAVADLLAERDGFRTIIVGAPGDVETANKTANQMKTPVTVAAGRTSISELKAVLSCSSLVVSNDTGTAHVASALGVPTVVIFGPTEHVSTRPYSDGAMVVRHDVECSPCMLRDCPIDHRCMTRVEVEDVYRAAKSLLVSV
jgi:heptosyltransferase-2